MLKDFDFHVTQVRYIKAAINDIANYSPDGKAVADVDSMLTDAGTTRQEYIDNKETFDLARAAFRQVANDGHDAVIGVYAAMKSRYRKDPASLEAINGLPTDDQTAADTLKRMQQTSSLWGKLPQIGTPPAQFVAWQGMNKTAFDALITDISNRQKNLPNDDQTFQVSEGDLHEIDDMLADFATQALVQGRAQFRDGTEREVLDAVPTEPAQHAPGQAVISQITAQGAGIVHLAFDAPHATSFDVFQKLKGDPDFTKVAEDTIERTYDSEKLDAGSIFDFKVVGRNSLGDGPESAVSTITVT